MGLSPEIPIGERVRFYREAQNKKQVVVAGLAGITEDYLSQIERGLKTPTIAVLHRLARILGVPTSVLLGEPSTETEGSGHPAASAIHCALMSYGGGRTTPPDLVELRARLDVAWRTWQSSPARYSELGALLTDLTVDIQQASRRFRAESEKAHRREAFRLVADLNFLLRTFTKRIGRVDLSLLVADRGVRAAEEADDPLRIAAAKWNLGQVLLATNETSGAEQVTIQAAEELEPKLHRAGGTDGIALYGALWLIGVIAAVRSGDAWTARDRLRERAWPAAKQAGEGNVYWTVFGPTNVSLHAVSVEMEAGEAAEALRLADDIEVSRVVSIERQMTFFLELARCYEQRRDDAAVLLHLLGAENVAREDLRYNVLARALVRGLLKRARPSFAPQVRELASRVGLVS